MLSTLPNMLLNEYMVNMRDPFDLTLCCTPMYADILQVNFITLHALLENFETGISKQKKIVTWRKIGSFFPTTVAKNILKKINL